MKAFSCLLRIPKEWTHVGRVDPKEEVQLTFALKQKNVDLLGELLRQVSDPDSAHYGRGPEVSLHGICVMLSQSCDVDLVLYDTESNRGLIGPPQVNT